jgi:magnesium-transporting ATPase (P-type)
MSVLVRDKSNNKIYAFTKGAPEKILKNSTLKIYDF